MSEHYYEIRVEGRLGGRWSDWFGLSMRHEAYAEGERACTVLSGRMDQAALHGVLTKTWNMVIPLISVRRVNEAEQVG